MSYDPPPPPRSNNSALIIVIVILGGVIVLGFGCAGLGMVAWLFTARTAEMQRMEAQVAREEALQAEAAARQEAEAATAEAKERAEIFKGIPPPSERARAEAVVALFLQRLRDDRPDDAFEMTSSVFKQTRDREAFGKFVKDHAGLRKDLHSCGIAAPEKPGDPTISYRFLSDLSGSIRVEALFTLSKENGHWLIDRIDIREDKIR